MVFRKDNNGLLYKINVKDENSFLKAQESGSIEYLKIGSDELPNLDNRFREHFFKIENEKIVLDATRTKEAWVINMQNRLEKHIYNNYSQKKQSQDEKFVSSYTTKLKAKGVTALEKKIVAMITSFLAGATLEDILKDVTAEQKPYYEKLIKVGVRTEWSENCIVEGKTAIAENREPVYAEFPTFK